MTEHEIPESYSDHDGDEQDEGMDHHDLGDMDDVETKNHGEGSPTDLGREKEDHRKRKRNRTALSCSECKRRKIMVCFNTYQP